MVVSKLHAPSNGAHANSVNLRAAKALFIIVPLLGITYLITLRSGLAPNIASDMAPDSAPYRPPEMNPTPVYNLVPDLNPMFSDPVPQSAPLTCHPQEPLP